MLHVVAGVLTDAAGRVLLARRPLHAHQGGLWEFPGGKREHGEDSLSALKRELHEELGIDVLKARPLIQIPHTYPEYKILLDVWRVQAFSGRAQGREGQAVRWVAPAALEDYAFPPPNRPILKAIQLPDRYLITPEPCDRKDWSHFLAPLERSLQRGVSLLQLRAKCLDDAELADLAREVRACCRRYGARVLLNGTPAQAAALGMDGVHLSAAMAASLSARSLSADLPGGALVAVSCHDEAELADACALGADFAVLSPVQPTASHPGAPALGWERFAGMVAASTIPVYALGGMQEDAIPLAFECGAQGIAAIGGLWG